MSSPEQPDDVLEIDPAEQDAIDGLIDLDADILSLEDTEPVELIEEDLSEDYLLAAAEHLDHSEGLGAEDLEGVEFGAEEDPERPGLRQAAPTINGFTCGSARAIGVRNYRIPGTRVSMPFRSEVAPLLVGFWAEFHRLVEPLVPGWCWGYAARSVRGSQAPSFHWAGIAGDGNAPRHPLGRRGTFTTKQAATIRRLCKKYGLRWGGDYRSRADEMHVEVILPRTKALALVRTLQRTPAPKPALPYYRTGSRVLRQGMIGTDVRDVQNALNLLGNRLPKDGYFRADTTVIVRRFQANRRMPVDGVVGPATLARLRKDIHK